VGPKKRRRVWGRTRWIPRVERENEGEEGAGDRAVGVGGLGAEDKEDETGGKVEEEGATRREKPSRKMAIMPGMGDGAWSGATGREERDTALFHIPTTCPPPCIPSKHPAPDRPLSDTFVALSFPHCSRTTVPCSPGSASVLLSAPLGLPRTSEAFPSTFKKERRRKPRTQERRTKGGRRAKRIPL